MCKHLDILWHTFSPIYPKCGYLYTGLCMFEKYMRLSASSANLFAMRSIWPCLTLSQLACHDIYHRIIYIYIFTRNNTVWSVALAHIYTNSIRHTLWVAYLWANCLCLWASNCYYGECECANECAVWFGKWIFPRCGGTEKSDKCLSDGCGGCGAI